MNDEELKRRKVHGFLSSKSLLESLDRLTLNRKIQNSPTKSPPKASNSYQEETAFFIDTKLNQYLHVQENLLIKSEGCFNLNENLFLNFKFLEIGSDDNLIPLMLEFNSDVPGNMQTNLEMKCLPSDVRIIPLEFKVAEGSFTESNAAFLKFSTNVFDYIKQAIPIVN